MYTKENQLRGFCMAIPTEKERIIITLGKDVFEKLKAESEKTGLSKSVLIQLALVEKYLNNKK